MATPITPTAPSGSLQNGNMIATPNANTTLGQVQTAQNNGWTSVNNPTLSNSISSTVNNITSNPPVVSATTTNSTTPVTLPTTNTTQTPTDLVGSNAPTPLNTDNSNNNGSSQLDAANNTLLQYMAKYATKGDTANQLNTQYGVDNLTSQSAQSQKDYLTAQSNYEAAQNASNQQIENMYQNNPTGQFAGGTLSEVQRQNNANLANLAVVANLAQANATGDATKLTAAQNIITNKLNQEFQPISDMIGYLQNYIQAKKNNLTASQIIDLQTKANNAVADHTALITSKQDAYNSLIQYGIYTPGNAQLIDNAQTPGEVTGSLLNAINPGSAATATTDPTSQYNLSSYSTDPTYQNQIQATSTKIGDVSLPSTADSTIKSSAPNSPITGPMLTQTATQAGIDPNVLASVLKVESNYGTEGAAVKNNNPGNVKFVGQANAVQGTKATDGGYFAKFNTIQDGLNAAASTIAKDKIAPVTQDNTTSSQPTQSGQDFATLQRTAPPMISAPGVLNQLGSTGSAYIDLSKIPSTLQGSPMLTTWAKNNNVALLSSDQVTNAVATDEALRNITQVIAPAWQQIAQNDRIGQLFNNLAEPSQAAFDTPEYQAIKTFQSNKENLAQQISALSKSAPRLGLLTTAENALPDFGGYSGSGFGTSFNPLTGFGTVSTNLGDTYADGVSKMNRTIQLLNQSLASYIPGDKGVPLLPTTKTASPYSVTAPDGTVVNIAG